MKGDDDDDDDDDLLPRGARHREENHLDCSDRVCAFDTNAIVGLLSDSCSDYTTASRIWRWLNAVVVVTQPSRFVLPMANRSAGTS